MLPLKWKIFKYLNYFYLLVNLGILVYLVWNAINSYMGGPTDIVVYISLTICPFLLATNSSINAYMIEVCYPDHYAKTLTNSSLLLRIFSFIILGLCALVVVIDINSLSDKDVSVTNDDYLLFIIGIPFIFLGTYICWMQIVLAKTIRRNFENAMDNFLKN